MKKQILFLISGIIIGALLVGVYFGIIRNKKEPPHKDILIGSRYAKLNYQLGEEIQERLSDLKEYENSDNRNAIFKECDEKLSTTYMNYRNNFNDYEKKMREIADNHLYNLCAEDVFRAFGEYKDVCDYIEYCYEYLSENDMIKYNEYYSRAEKAVSEAMEIFRAYYEECDKLSLTE